MKSRRLTVLGAALAVTLIASQTGAQEGVRHLPARDIPVPDTVSPQMQEVIRRPLRPDLERTPKIGGRLEGAHRTSRGSGRRNASRPTTASRCEIGTDRDWWRKGLSRHPGIGSGSEPRSPARPCPRWRLRAWARRSRYARGDFDGWLRPDEDPFCGLSHAARFSLSGCAG